MHYSVVVIVATNTLDSNVCILKNASMLLTHLLLITNFWFNILRQYTLHICVKLHSIIILLYALGERAVTKQCYESELY